MPRRPIEAVIHDLVYNLDAGAGLQILRGAVYCLMVVAGILVFTATQFIAFSEPEAMEYAQLGRNLAETGTLTTQVVRPSTMRFLIERTGGTVEEEEGGTRQVGGDPRIESHPDILHPPVYPVLLAGWFKLLGTNFQDVPQGGKYPPELAIVALNHIFAVATGILVWLIGRMLFSPRVGFLAMTVFFLSDMVWRNSISGLNITVAGFLVTAACYFALVAVSRQEAGASKPRWIIPFLATAGLCVLMVLTRYGTAVMIPALALYFWIGFPRRGGSLALLLLALCAVGVSPWLMRNVQVSGAPLGFLTETPFIDTRAFLGDSFERTLAPGLEEMSFMEQAEMIQRKWFRNTEDLYRKQLSILGDGLLICLFVTAFFHRFVRRNVHQFRWCILLALVLFLGLAGYFTVQTERLIYLFWPMVILYALAFYYYMLDRLNLPMAVQRLAITTLVVLLSAAPLVMNLMRRESYPYPPYLRPYITYVSDLLEPSELMCTDIPWATAWYGNRDSLLLPQNIDEFYEIHDLVKHVGALYFTTETRNRPFIRGLVLGKERSWFPIQQMQMPANFPLQLGTYLLQGDQLLLIDRDRSAERAQRSSDLTSPVVVPEQ